MIGTINCFSITFSIALAVYLSTVAPSTSGGDAGELLAEGCALGTAHPPGYPAIIVLFHAAGKIGRAFDLKPALSVNILCCILGAASAGLLSSSVYIIQHSFAPSISEQCGSKKQRKMRRKNSSASTNHHTGGSETLNIVSAISSALIFAFSPIAWQYSVTAEVFALHSFLVSAIVHTSVRYAAQQTERLTYLGAFLCGAALTNQHTAILLVMPVAIWVVYESKLLHRSRRSVLLKAALSFLGPILVFYSTMPYLAIARPHWGSWGDVTSLGGFFHHLLRRDYGTLQLYSGNDDGAECPMDRMLQWGADYFTSQSGNNPLVCFCFLLGCRYMMTLKLAIGRIIISCLAFYLTVFGMLANLPLSNPLFYAIHQRFWLHPNLLACISVGIGLTKVGATSRSKIMTQILVFAMAASVLNSLRRGLRTNDESGNVYFDRYARSVLQPLPKGSLLFLNYDQAWTSIRYLQECEAVREDITSINTSMMSYPWFESKHQQYDNLSFPGTHYTANGNPGFTMADFLDQNYRALGGNIFIVGPLNYSDQAYRERYEEIPFGLTRRIVLKEDEPGLETFRAESQATWSIIAEHFASDSGLPDASRYDESTWEYTITVMFWDALIQSATHLLDLASREDVKSSLALSSLVEVTAWVELAVANDDKAASNPNVRKNLGVGYMRIVQSKALGPECLLPSVQDVFVEVAGDLSMLNLNEHVWNEKEDGGDCKAWASLRWQFHTQEFLMMDQAKALSDYGQVKAIYDLVVGQVAEKTRTMA